MSYGTGAAGTSQRVITAFFDSRTDAEEAVSRLHSAGIAHDRVRLVAGQEGGASSVSSRGTDEDKGFWESLGDLFLPDEDRNTYAEGLRRGGYLVTVQASDSEYDRALDILDDEGTIDLDERADSWRSEGWTGRASAGGFGLSPSEPRPRDSYTDSTTAETSREMGQTEEDEVVQLAEEQLHVGKRDVSHGRVRVRSYVVERPVQEEVTLRQENVRVERRPVGGRAGASSGDELFRERTIEMDEKREEAVISKEARVTEELVVRKDVDERTETISDTVRKTEVDIEDDRGAALSDRDRTERR